MSTIAQVQDITPRIQYVAGAGQTIFIYPFPVFDEGDIAVEKNGVTLTLATDYTVSGVGAEDGGDITLTVGATAGDIITIYRDMALDRLIDYQQNGDFLADNVNRDYDRLWLAIQQVVGGVGGGASLGRAWRASPGDSLTANDLIIAPESIRNNTVVGFDSNGKFTYVPPVFSQFDGKQFDTLSACLLDTTLSPGQTIVVLGRDLADDGGGNVYKFRAAATGTHDNGKWINHANSNGQLEGTFPGSYFSIKQWGAVGDSSNDDGPAIQAALNYANSLSGLPIHVPKGDFLSGQTLRMGAGTVIYGDGIGTPTAPEGVSTIRAGANLTYLLTQTDETDATQPFTIRDLSIHGNKGAGFTVGTCVALRGRSIRILNNFISNGSGNGLHLLPTVASPFDPAWVNWVRGNHISNHDGYGIKNENSDSFFTDNYFSNNTSNYQKVSGGNSWKGNHFDNAEFGLEVFWDDNWHSIVGTEFGIADRFEGNYFDNNITGMKIDGTTTGGAPSRSQSHIILGGNRFRGNNLHVDLIGLSNQIVDGCEFSSNSDRAATINPASPLNGLLGGIRWTNCVDGSVVGCSFDRFFTHPSAMLAAAPVALDKSPMFVNKPSSTTVRATRRADTGGTSPLYSERSTTAQVLSGNTSTTVSHRLFDAPACVTVTQLNGASFFQCRVSNVTQTTFDIEVDSAPGADQTFSWYASYTQ